MWQHHCFGRVSSANRFHISVCFFRCGFLAVGVRFRTKPNVGGVEEPFYCPFPITRHESRDMQFCWLRRTIGILQRVNWFGPAITGDFFRCFVASDGFIVTAPSNTYTNLWEPCKSSWGLLHTGLQVIKHPSLARGFKTKPHLPLSPVRIV